MAQDLTRLQKRGILLMLVGLLTALGMILFGAGIFPISLWLAAGGVVLAACGSAMHWYETGNFWPSPH